MKNLTIQSAKISTLLFLISITGVALNPWLPSEAKEINTPSDSTQLIQAQNSQRKSTFTAVGKQTKTTGTVQVVQENGKRYLVLSSDFSTPEGPDVFLILHRDHKVKTKIEEKDYINVAMLEKFSGGQRYLIPDNVNLDDFKSVGIWCRQFNVTFAFAPLK